MPYTYDGDISGTLDENLEPYDLEELGVEYEEVYMWKCGCKTLLDELCDCGYESEDSDSENNQGSEPYSIDFHVSEHHIEDINTKIQEILESFGTHREEIFNAIISGQNLNNFSQDMAIFYRKQYCKYKIALQILDCIKESNRCIFYIDL
jgi:hypothetical protein